MCHFMTCFLFVPSVFCSCLPFLYSWIILTVLVYHFNLFFFHYISLCVLEVTLGITIYISNFSKLTQHQYFTTSALQELGTTWASALSTLCYACLTYYTYILKNLTTECCNFCFQWWKIF